METVNADFADVKALESLFLKHLFHAAVNEIMCKQNGVNSQTGFCKHFININEHY